MENTGKPTLEDVIKNIEDKNSDNPDYSQNLEPCEHCGNHISKRALICPKCGGDVVGDQTGYYFDSFELIVFFIIPIVGFLTYASNVYKAKQALEVSCAGLVIEIGIIIFALY